MGAEPRETWTLLERVRALSVKPLVVKLTPNVADVVPVARAAEEAGADAASLINTLRGLAVDPGSNRRWLGAGHGGLSGSAVRSVALEMVYSIASETRLPLVGMGGIQSGRDALDFLAAGARCVAVGTESFRDPAAGLRVRSELSEELAGSGFERASDAVGVALDRSARSSKDVRMQAKSQPA
jgi:dihydroorotate dehydrogenase (NAD+) catalytic subunit